MTHVLAVLGMTAAIIGWHLIQRYAFGPEGATACGKPKADPSSCENRWDLIDGDEKPAHGRRSTDETG